MINKIIDKINNFSEKIGKGKYSLILIVAILLIIMGIYQTYSLFTQSAGISYSNNTKTYTFVIGDNKENEIAIDANDSKYIDISLKNDKGIELSYALYYNLNDTDENVTVGFLKETTAKPEGTIKDNETIVVSLKIINNKDKIIKVKLGINSGTTKGGNLKQSGTRVTQEIINLDKSKANSPELDNNLIPVYYNQETAKWHKADESNNNSKYKWYDYSNKEWANAVIVKDNTRNNYLNSQVGTLIKETDILSYFVWIPRYKYKIWNIERNISDNYLYDAYSKGIQIKFETGVESTGNLNCSYNPNNDDSKKDNCTTTNNDELWYTHPAFSYGDSELTGFWVGKYTTTGTINEPTILPDALALRNINISTAFTTAKKINHYKINSNLDAHLLKNTEWGAINYLTHSIYGLCTEDTCEKVSSNNSTLGITGRIAENWQDETTSEDGSYSYDGYKIIDKNKSQEKDTKKISSSTNNIYGIYDLRGRLSEYVMANMQTPELTINSQKAGENWNNINNLATKYYDIYAYGETTNDNSATNRSRLGDATGEVTISVDNKITTWNNKGNKEVIFINKDNAWFVRGGQTGIFNYESQDGDKHDDIGFRISLS